MKKKILFILFIIPFISHSQPATRQYVDSSLNAFRHSLDSSVWRNRFTRNDTTINIDTIVFGNKLITWYQLKFIYHDSTTKTISKMDGDLFVQRDSLGKYAIISFSSNPSSIDIKKSFTVAIKNNQLLVLGTGIKNHTIYYGYSRDQVNICQ